MNKVNCYVTEVLSEPCFIDNKEKYGEEHQNWWAIKVKYNSYGREKECELHFDSKREALQVEEGYKFLR